MCSPPLHCKRGESGWDPSQGEQRDGGSGSIVPVLIPWELLVGTPALLALLTGLGHGEGGCRLCSCQNNSNNTNKPSSRRVLRAVGRSFSHN